MELLIVTMSLVVQVVKDLQFTDNTEKFRITSAGLVGINETPTISQFQVKKCQLGGTSGNTQEVLRLHSPRRI